MSVLNELYWREAAWLWAILIPFIVLPLIGIWQAQHWGRLVDRQLLPWATETTQNSINKSALTVMALAWVLLIIALAGPRTPQWIPPEAHPDQTILMIVLDLSASMSARDERPNRRQRAINLLQQWPRPHYATGIILYAGHAQLLLPATTDQAIQDYYLSGLETLQQATLGNDLSTALNLAADQFAIQPNNPHTLLLITDGDLDKAAQLKAEAALQKLTQNVTLRILGVGGDEDISVPDHRGGWIHNDQNQTVLSHQQRQWLNTLARLGHGEYRRVSSALEFQQWLASSPPRIPPEEAHRVLWKEWFALPLLIGITLLLGVLLRGKPNTLMLISALTLTLPSPPSQADLLSARQALSQQNYSLAQQLFTAQTGYNARFGEGEACFRLKDNLCAQQAFSRAAWIASNDKDHARAVFNLANSHFRLGDYDQSVVLFEEVQFLKTTLGTQLDLSTEQIDTNLAFAQSLANSVRRQLAKINASIRRLEWRNAASQNRPEDLEKLAMEMNFLQPNPGSSNQSKLPLALVWRGLIRALGGSINSSAPSASSAFQNWGQASDLQPHQTSTALWQRLLEMELGFPAPVETPHRLPGQRPW